MEKLDKGQLLSINGGAFSATFLNAISRAGSLILELGRSVGNAIRRITTNTLC